MASLIVFGQLGEIEVSEENFRDFHTLSAVKTRSDENFWGFSHPSQLCKHGPQKKIRGFDRVPSPILCQLLPLGRARISPTMVFLGLHTDNRHTELERELTLPRVTAGEPDSHCVCDGRPVELLYM